MQKNPPRKSKMRVLVTLLRHQVPIKNIERELICPICKELFTHPLILPCQHSICHKCVRELLMMNHEDSFDAGSECSLPGSPRSRVPSPSMERLDRLVRSGGSRGKAAIIDLSLNSASVCFAACAAQRGEPSLGRSGRRGPGSARIKCISATHLLYQGRTLLLLYCRPSSLNFGSMLCRHLRFHTSH